MSQWKVKEKEVHWEATTTFSFGHSFGLLRSMSLMAVKVLQKYKLFHLL